MSSTIPFGTPVDDVKVARKLLLAAVRASAKQQAGIMEQAAYATEAAFANGLIGTGDGAVYATAQAYADAALVNKTTVSLWKSLGRATTFGINPTDTPDLWKSLAHRSHAIESTVRAAIMADGATVETVQTAWSKVYDASGAKRKQDKRAPGGTVNQTETDAPTVKGKTPAARIKSALKILADETTDVAPEVAALAIVTALDKSLVGNTMSREAWSKIESALNATISREVALLAKREEDAAAA